MAFVGYCALEQWDWNHPRLITVTRRPPYNPDPFLKRSTLDMRTAVKYGGDIGIRRIRDVLVEEGIPFSMLITGSYIEDFPEIVKELAELGFEMNAHCWSYSDFFTGYDKAGQLEIMKRTVDAIKRNTGKTPTGWLGQSATADENTIENCIDMDFLYNSDLQDDELPYFIDMKDKTLVEVPYRMLGNLNDYLLFQQQTMSLRDSFEFLKQSFDLCYTEAERQPLLFNYGTHPFLTGRADIAQLMREFLRYVKSRNGVWMTTLEGVAKHWKERFNGGYGV
jgi:peptidoglycan/xylan/chitin deacetylase (PgdA/CDA1 family)